MSFKDKFTLRAADGLEIVNVAHFKPGSSKVTLGKIVKMSGNRVKIVSADTTTFKWPNRTTGGPPGRRAARFALQGEWADKRGSVVDDHLSGTTVADGLKRAYPSDGRAGLSRSYSPLLRVGFAKPPRRRDAGALLPHRFSFSPVRRSGGGVFFSVALSVGSRRPAVSWHPALWSPDFPHAPARGRAAVRPTPPPILAAAGPGTARARLGAPDGDAGRRMQLRPSRVGPAPAASPMCP